MSRANISWEVFVLALFIGNILGMSLYVTFAVLFFGSLKF